MTYAQKKRLFDLCFSLVILLCGIPVFILIAFLIKISSKGPIFFSSPRVGKGGSIFPCFKFRTMHLGADKKLEVILKENPKLQEEWKIYHKLKKDPRITTVGKFLRKTSLDELPQFWNVLIGDLSVVGPRPYFPLEIQECVGEKAAKILSVRPGITGLWQTSGRSCLSLMERINIELSYIDKQSFLLDLNLIWKTIPSLVFSKGAF